MSTQDRQWKRAKIINTDHKRDKSSAINELIEQVCALLENPVQAKQWLNGIRSDKPRYIRDQLLMIKKIIDETTKSIIDKAFIYCMENKITSATDFKTIVIRLSIEEPVKKEAKIIKLNPLNGTIKDTAIVRPNTSKIEDYQSIIKNNNQNK